MRGVSRPYFIKSGSVHIKRVYGLKTLKCLKSYANQKYHNHNYGTKCGHDDFKTITCMMILYMTFVICCACLLLQSLN